MDKKKPTLATPEFEFQYGIESRQVIVDTKNVLGQLWLYVNRHPDNKELIRVLKKIHPHPTTYSQTGLKRKSQLVFGYEFIFKRATSALNKLKRLGFKLR